MKTVFNFFISVVVLALIAFGLLSFFELPTGELIDWIVGFTSFLWLIVIVTVPWNAHFKAREVLDDAEISKRKDILVVDETLNFAKKIAKRSLIVAISLHIASAVALYLIAYFNISEVGVFAALAALLLTFLRPSVRFYEYLNQKLGNIKQEFRYPREDLYETLNKVEDLKFRLENIENDLSMEEDVDSWKKQVNADLTLLHKEGEKQELKLDDLKNETNLEFTKVRTEQAEKFAKVTEDSKVLDAVREIGNFVKQLR
ncbi:MAG: hypothetical protein ACI85I_000538 [Arenicella sp.]|jgi:hypothetical protein